MPQTVVLVVEDEVVLRLMAVAVVESAGFQAIEASNADEAICILESRNDIRIVFTDIDMLGSMDGMKLAAPLATGRDHPDVRAYCAGRRHAS
jgi:CheY-like chemotaxis protein